MRSARHLRRVILVILLALFSVAGFGQSDSYKPGSPLLMWKVSSKTNSAYVLGSVHLGNGSMYPLPQVIENAFAAASVLIVEVNMNKVDKAQLQQFMMASGSYPAGDDLFKHISPETHAKLSAFLGSYGIPPEAFAKFRPWMVSLTVSTLPLIKSGMNPNEGVDRYFLNKAGSKRVEELEDAEWQIKLLAEYPESDADRSLLHAIDQAKTANETASKLESLWSHGEADEIKNLIARTSEGESKEEKAFRHRIIEGRNPHMADRLEKCLQSASESCFMVVGAAHVIGSEGIVHLLQSRGYKAEQAVVGSPTH